MQRCGRVFFQLLPNLLCNLRDHRLPSNNRKIQLIHKHAREHVRRDEGLVQVPEKGILEAERRRHVRLLVRQQVLVDAELLRVGGRRQRGLGPEGRDVEVDADRHERRRQRRLHVRLPLRQHPLGFPHPVAPDPLHVHGRHGLLAELLRLLGRGARGVRATTEAAEPAGALLRGP